MFIVIYSDSENLSPTNEVVPQGINILYAYSLKSISELSENIFPFFRNKNQKQLLTCIKFVSLTDGEKPL